MNWQKQGLIFVPTGELWWARSYSTIPTAQILDNQRIRIFFAALDELNYGRIGYVDVDIHEPREILYLTQEPVLDLGPLGAFDDSGVNPSCALDVAGQTYLYYIGWQRAQRIPYMLFSGLAISSDRGGTFEKISSVPVLDRIASEPFSRSAPFVCVEQGIFKAWYWSCTHWSIHNGSPHYNNVIKYAESSDGITWKATDQVCITPREPGEYSVGRPWIIRDPDHYRMWYSIRSMSSPYRIGYAESGDGTNWTRMDEKVGIGLSEVGWDSEMICYPCVIDAGGRRLMFYNGNRHGQSGFGYAILQED